jgi:hypothetical protein
MRVKEKPGGFRRNNEEGGENKGGFGGGGFRRNNEDGVERKPFERRSRDNEGGEGGLKTREARGEREGGENGGEEDEGKKERYIRIPINDDEESLCHTIPTVNLKKQAEIPVELSGEDSNTIKKIESFQEPGFSDVLFGNITISKYDTPTPLQKFAIPIILNRRDLMACAQTGSGKRAAYILPILANILQDGIQPGINPADNLVFDTIQTPQALILAPTSKLAIDILTECNKLCFKSIIKINMIYGGTILNHHIKYNNWWFGESAEGTNILVATPGRLLDFINKGKISLENHL